MKRDKKLIFCLLFFIPTLVFIIMPALYVFIVDPLWQWNHPFHLSRYHTTFNERLTKCNYIASRRSYVDTLIIGSSRSAYMNPADLASANAFNFSVSSGHPREYPEYLNLVKRQSRLPLKKILIEASFFQYLQTSSKKENPSDYTNNAGDIFVRFQALFSRDAYQKAKDVKKNPFHNSYYVSGDYFTSYRRAIPQTEESKMKIINDTLQTYRNDVYARPSDSRHQIYLKNTQEELRGLPYVVYIPPVSKYLLALLIEKEKLNDYEEWIRELVAQYGKVYNFMYPNDITLNDDNFQDAHHSTPECSRTMLKIIQGLSQSPTVCIITKHNIEQKLRDIRESFEKL